MKDMKNCKLIACRTMEDEIQSLITPDFDGVYMLYGQHKKTKILK